MAEVDLEVEGLNGWMALAGGSVTLRRKLLFGRNKGVKSIDLASITAIQWKDAGLLTQGFIQLVFAGSNESKGSRGDAWSDENTISFTRPQQAGFAELRRRVDRARAQRTPAAIGTSSLADELSKLAALKDAGHIDDAEFATMKARLLG